MKKQYQYISQVLAIAILAIASTAIAPVWAQRNTSIQPRKGDANRLRSVQGQPVLPTNIDQFAPTQDLSNANLKIQKVNLEVGTVEPVIPGNYNASPQKVNKSGSFSSDPLNAIPIFQESTSPRSKQQNQ